MNIAVITLYDAAMSEMGRLTTPNKREYCARHGYHFHEFTAALDATRHPSWSKIKALQRTLPEHEWVLWMDADTVVMDLNRKLEDFCDPSLDLVIGSEPNHPNCGVMLFRNSSASHIFLQEIWEAAETKPWIRFKTECPWEQEVIVTALAERPHDLRHLVASENLNANYHKSGNVFILHPYGTYLEARLQYCDEAVNPNQSFCDGGDDLYLAELFGRRKGRLMEMWPTRDGCAHKLIRRGWAANLIEPLDYLREQLWDATYHFFNSVRMHPAPVEAKYDLFSCGAALDELPPYLEHAMVARVHWSNRVMFKQAGFPFELHRTEQAVILARRGI